MAANAAVIRDRVLSTKLGGKARKSGGGIPVKDDCTRIPYLRDAAFRRSTVGIHLPRDMEVAGVVQETQSVDATMAKK
jgi:hypothetical protein